MSWVTHGPSGSALMPAIGPRRLARCIRTSTGTRVRPRGVQTATVKQSAAASTSQWAARHSRQVVRVLRSGGGFEAALLAHVGDGAPRDLMPEVAAGTPNTGVAPLAVLGGHPDDEPADRVHDPWAARSATAAAVVLPRDQLSMPAEEGLGRDQGVQVTAYPSPEARGLCGPAPALGVGEPELARTELLSEDAILFLERVNDVNAAAG